MNILALHGFAGSSEDFGQLRALISANWRCPSLPRHIGTEAIHFEPAAIEKTINREVAAFQLKGPKMLIAYSMGARAVLSLHSVFSRGSHFDRIVLISPNPGLEEPRAKRERKQSDDALAKSIENQGIDSFLERWQQNPLIEPQWRSHLPDLKKRYLARKKLSTKAIAQSLREFGQGVSENQWSALEKIEIPTLVVTGSMDVKYSSISEKMVQKNPSLISRTVVPNASHAPHIEAAQETASRIRAFLSNGR